MIWFYPLTWTCAGIIGASFYLFHIKRKIRIEIETQS